jgi:hypothetical protein
MEFVRVSSYLVPFQSFSFLASKLSSLMMVKNLHIIAWRKWWNTGTHAFELEIEREEKVRTSKT